jgi:hypothetical protein
MSFWDIMWFIFVSYAFVAYLMMLFSIIADLFRDRELSGFAKAIWFVVLLVVPFLAALVYLVVRGGGMAERSARTYEAARSEQEAYIKQVAGTNTPTDQIAQARTMLDAGTISQTEFDTLKARALAAV